MAPIFNTSIVPVDIIFRRDATDPASDGGAYNLAVWQGGLNVASVDLIAMVVSDAGLASISPEWWNSSPLACMLIGLQPRGGWQIMQRAVQWDTDKWARCFGVKCDMPSLYEYFACSIRNRLEVWNSKDFICPTLGPKSPDVDGKASSLSDKSKTVTDSENSPGKTRSASATDSAGQKPRTKPQQSITHEWIEFDVDSHRHFSVKRPTKLIDGSRGGQAFMCKLLRPPEGHSYSIEEQARMQMWSVLLVAVGLMHRREIHFLSKALEKDFQMTVGLGTVFGRLAWGLLIANTLVLGFIITVFYALWQRNIFGEVAPFAIQLCSLASWAVGSTGLLMLGGNPSVEIGHQGEIPMHIQNRIYKKKTPQASQNHQNDGNENTASPEPIFDDERLTMDENGNVKLKFGSLHGSIFTDDQGECDVPATALEAICSLEMKLSRAREWHVGIIWFMLHLGISITLQIAGAKVATVASEVMGVVILIATSVFRGAGVSGPEEWMIPGWAMRPGAGYTVSMLGKKFSR